MSSVLDRILAVFEVLADRPEGMSVKGVADRLNMPASAAHRLLNDLVRAGYVRQERDHGDYRLTIKLAMLGMSFLARSGVLDVAQPILDQLAKETKELARLSIIEGRLLAWVARSQGATSGLRYDPDADQGTAVHLATTASGTAWLMTMSNEEALERVAEQGFRPADFELGPNAPRSAAELIERLKVARKRGYSTVRDSFQTGIAAMAAPVRNPVTRATIGVISVGGPAIRLTEARIEEYAPTLLAAAANLGATNSASPLLNPRR